MKKLIIAVAAIFVSVAAFAQGGIVAGYTASQMSLKDEIKNIGMNVKSAPNFHVGFAYHQPLVLGFAIQPEILYANKGTTYGLAGTDVVGRMSYIEVPVQLQWGIDLIALKPYIFAEPFVGYAVSGKLDVKGIINTAKEFDINDLDSRLEYGFSVGAGVMLLGHIQASFKYFWNFDQCGFGDYMKNVQTALSDSKGFSGLSLSAAIFF
ncbi:MAG: PorT family protein [Bacteroidales bacterium]|nr:PorT family protein [Bacteroidales bacterium]